MQVDKYAVTLTDAFFYYTPNKPGRTIRRKIYRFFTYVAKYIGKEFLRYIAKDFLKHLGKYGYSKASAKNFIFNKVNYSEVNDFINSNKVQKAYKTTKKASVNLVRRIFALIINLFTKKVKK